MRTGSLSIICLCFSLAVFLLARGQSKGQPASGSGAAGPEPESQEAWQSRITSFLEKLDEVLTASRVPEWDGKYHPRDASGQTVFWFNRVAEEGTCQAEVERVFVGRPVSWEGKIREVSSGKETGTATLHFQLDDLPDGWGSMKRQRYIGAWAAVIQSNETSEDLHQGQVVRVEGILTSPSEDKLLDGLRLLHGRAGSISVHITRSNARLSNRSPTKAANP